MLQIGLFGGSFDPVHNAHIEIIRFLLESPHLDEVWLIPSKMHPFKGELERVTDADRIEMLRLAITPLGSHVRIIDYELQQDRVNYTLETVEYLQDIHPEYKFSFILGSDNLNSFHSWNRFEEILRRVELICFIRPGYDPHPDAALSVFAERIHIIRDLMIDLASTDIRNLVEYDQPISAFVPAPVADYIELHGLYR